jgi:uncharacterized protein YkwD
MKRFTLLFALLIAFTLIIAGCGDYNKMNTDDGIVRSEILFVHNKERMKKGKSYLEMSPVLTAKAQKWAEWMAKNNKMVHADPRAPGFGYGGENIAMGQSDIDEVMTAWMNSPGHRTNILSKNYTHAGFGYARFNGRTFWCTNFGGN